jgi:hypothetical protein
MGAGMKLVEAIWEKRNLGVDCLELHCEAHDAAAAVLDALPLSAAYQVIRVPAKRTDLLLAVQERGYRLIEMGIDLERRLADFEMPAIYKRFEKNMAFRRATGADIERTLEIIETGRMFTTDRIALDPSFSPQQAGHRYVCWIRDLLQQGGALHVAAYNGRDVAFGVAIERQPGAWEASLGGVFPEPGTSGLGFASVYLNTAVPRQQGGAKVVTRVSSNNLPIFRLHLLFGYEPTNLEYVLIRHAVAGHRLPEP